MSGYYMLKTGKLNVKDRIKNLEEQVFSLESQLSSQSSLITSMQKQLRQLRCTHKHTEFKRGFMGFMFIEEEVCTDCYSCIHTFFSELAYEKARLKAKEACTVKLKEKIERIEANSAFKPTLNSVV